ncbi:MAG: hypothetical protein U0892_06890 [Pirellulales bacterium]
MIIQRQIAWHQRASNSSKTDQFRNYLGMPSVAAAAQQGESNKVQPASTDHVEEQVIHPSVVTMFSRQVQPNMLTAQAVGLSRFEYDNVS